MKRPLAVLVVSSVVFLGACGGSDAKSDGATQASEADPGSVDSATTLYESPPADVPTPTEANKQIRAAFEAQGLEICKFEDGDGQKTYAFAPCGDEYAGEEVGGAAWVVSYRTLDAQEADYSLRDMDLGLKGWAWKLNTIVFSDSDHQPGVIEKVEAAMDDLGAEVVFDGTEYNS